MSIDIGKLEALARAATPGARDAVKAPNRNVMTDGENRPWIVQSDDGQIIIVQGERASDDAKLAAAADPDAILALVERVREAEARERALAAHMERLSTLIRDAMESDNDFLTEWDEQARGAIDASPTTSLASRDAQMKAEAFVEASAACMHIEKGQNSLAWMHKEVAPDGEEYVGENGIPYSNKALGAQHCRDEMARLHISYLRQAEAAKAGEGE